MKLVASFLSDQKTKIRMDDYTSDPFPIAIGLPQGSPLLVILYILYNNYLLTNLFSLDSDSVSIGYVDDVVHLVASRTEGEASFRIGQRGSHLLEWAKFGSIFEKKALNFYR